MEPTSDTDLPVLLRERQVLQRVVPWHRSTLWDRIRAGDFPPPVRLSPGSVAWRRDEVLAWVASRVPDTSGQEAHTRTRG